MNRYFFRISYDGSAFSGWQKQDNAPSIQQSIEENLSALLKHDIEIVGCGRTDAGVHASQYFFHTDLDMSALSRDQLIFRLNKILPAGIAIHDILLVANDAHARFDAISRSYSYFLHFGKQIFERDYSFRYNQSALPDPEKVQEAARIISEYNSFFCFCKTHSDVNNYNCNLTRCEWLFEENKWEFRISANRFLRGMVRLIVGCCLQVGISKISITELRNALEKQERLKYAWSVPAHGLFLTEVLYD